jgi:hypothetical protein
MPAKIISNRSAYFRGGPTGIGGRNLGNGLISWIGAISNTAGDVIFLSAADVSSNNRINLGYAMQAVGGAVNVFFTLQNIGTATDPNSQPEINWGTATAVAAGAPVHVTVPFSAMKVVFAAAGTEFYCVAR